MGVYDYVEFSCECPNCKAEIKRFQTKDGPRVFAKLTPLMVSDFYTSCGKCGSWISYNREKEPPPIALPEYGSMADFSISHIRIGVQGVYED